MRRILFAMVVLTGPGCTTLLGIDEDYTLEPSSSSGGPGSSAGATTSTGGAGSTATAGGTASTVSTSSSGGEVGGAGGGGAVGSGGGGGDGGGPEATCEDDLENGDETDTDCGGSCDPCSFGDDCEDPGDCDTEVCGGGSCACPEGKTPGAGGCICRTGHVACGDGPAAPCIEAQLGDGAVRLLGDAVAPRPEQLFLSANRGRDTGEVIPPSYALFWSSDQGAGGEGPGTPLFARFEIDGTPRGDTESVQSAPAVPLGVEAEGLDESVLVGDTVANEGITIEVVDSETGPVGGGVSVVPGGPLPDRVASVAMDPGEAGVHALAYTVAGALRIVAYRSDQVLGSADVIADGVTTFAIGRLQGKGLRHFGLAFVRGGELFFARFTTSAVPLVPITSLDPIEIADLDVDRPLFVASEWDRWVIGGTTDVGGVVLGVLGAGAALADTAEITLSGTELRGLVASQGHVHAIWQETNTSVWFTRIDVGADAPEVELPFLALDLPFNGAHDVLRTTTMRTGSGVLEIGVAVEVSGTGDQGEDGIYLGRLATCPP